MDKSNAGDARLNFIGVILAAVITAAAVIYADIPSDKLQFEDLAIFNLVEKSKFLSKREIELILNMKQMQRFAISGLNNDRTGFRFPSTPEFDSYKNLEKNGYIRFNVDIAPIERLIKQHGFKTDDFSYKNKSGYAEYYNYESSTQIPEELANNIQKLAVEITPAGKLFAEQLLNAFIDDFLLIKQKELEKIQGSQTKTQTNPSRTQITA